MSERELRALERRVAALEGPIRAIRVEERARVIAAVLEAIERERADWNEGSGGDRALDRVAILVGRMIGESGT